MTASDLLGRLHHRGVQIHVEGDRLRWRAAVGVMSGADIAALRVHKKTILALLRPANDGWSVDDWLAFYDKRAGIAEFDGGLSRLEAEARAFACCVVEWMNRNPVRSEPDQCLACGGSDQVGGRLLPFGTRISGHAWLHSACWEAWFQERKAEAVATLAAMGIGTGKN